MIPLAVPNLGPLEQEYAAKAISNGHVGPDGPFVQKFQEKACEITDSNWAIATTTGSSALYASALTLGFAGKKVRVNKRAFPAMANILKQLGCKIKWYNYEEEWNDHDLEFYSPSGQLYPTIIDAAPAFGETPMDDEASSVVCFSFAANKIMTCGQGGLIVGNDRYLGDCLHCDVQNRVGRNNFRMGDINAAIGLAQIERMDELMQAKKDIWDTYNKHLPMLHRGRSRWMATMDASGHDLIKLHHFLRDNNIETRMEHLMQGISLPCSTTLTKSDQRRVIETVEQYLSLPVDERTEALSNPS
jgi:perosamine synthetase